MSLCKFQISYVRHVISLEMYAAFLGEVCAQTHAKYLYVLLLAQVTFKSSISNCTLSWQELCQNIFKWILPYICPSRGLFIEGWNLGNVVKRV